MDHFKAYSAAFLVLFGIITYLLLRYALRTPGIGSIDFDLLLSIACNSILLHNFAIVTSLLFFGFLAMTRPEEEKNSLL